MSEELNRRQQRKQRLERRLWWVKAADRVGGWVALVLLAPAVVLSVPVLGLLLLWQRLEEAAEEWQAEADRLQEEMDDAVLARIEREQMEEEAEMLRR